MKILHINPFFHPYMGGTEKYLYELCRRHAKKHDVHVVTARLEGTKKYEVLEGIHIHRVPSIILKKLPSFLPPPFASTKAAFVMNVCREVNPDLMHLHNRFMPSFASVALWKRLFGKPLFLSLHNAKTVGIDAVTDFGGQLYDNYFGNIIMRSADFIIANSKWTNDVTVPKDYPKKQTQVIYNGVDTKKYKKTKSDLKDKLGCENMSITVCRLQPQKGVEYLVRALPLVKKDFKAVVIGRGPEQKNLEKLASNLGVSDKLVFTGNRFIPEEKMPEYYSAADFSILPSLWEPFGIALAESMACGTPCISTKAAAIPEVVGDSGILVEPRNPNAIADAINTLIEDEGLRKKLGKMARERAEKYFEWNIIAKQVEKCYKDFLE